MNHGSSFAAARLRPLALALTLALGVPAAAYGQSATQAIAVPAQPLGQALAELARQAKLQLLVAPELVAGKMAPAVQGELSADEALRRMLAGSGLRAREEAGGTIVIVAAPAPASALPRGEGEARVLSEVVVTGEKTTRSLERTAASVRVIDEETLIENPGTPSVNSVLDGVANVTSTGTQNLAPAVRGIDGTGPAQGADAFLAGTRPRLNLQVDGRPAGYNEVTFGDFSLWDVEQVEVFRGAQSLLQGRNAIAGTIIVKSKDPSFERELGARAIVGNHQQRQISAVVNTPLLEDEIALRIAVDRQSSDSFVEGFQGYPRVDDPGEFESTTVRAKLLVQPKALPDLTNLLTLAHSEYHAPQTESVRRPFDDMESSYPRMPVFAPRTTSGVLDTTWKLSDALSVENRLTVADFKVRRKAVAGDGNVEIDGKDYSLEPRLRFASPGGASGFVGAYLFRAKQDESIDMAGGGTFDDKTTTAAAYGEATVPLRSDLDLTVGARYEQENRRRTGSMWIFAIDLDETYRAFLPKLGLAWRATDAVTLGAGVSRGYNGGGAGFTYDEPYTSYTFDPEYVWNYEGYARANLLDGRLRLTGNVFYSRYRDMQLPFDLNPDPSVWAFVVRNADRAETYGAEVGATWLPVPELRFNAELGLLKTRIERFADSALEGNELPRAPALTANFGVSYLHGSGFEAGANARYSESYYSNALNTSRGKTDPYWIVNARVGYTFGAVRAFAYVNNLFDTDTPILIDADPAGTRATDTAILPKPRTLGVGIEAWF